MLENSQQPPLDKSGQSRLSERYELLEKIGEGGMGTVVKARQITSGRIVAIKLLSAQYVSNEKKRNRFEQEAKIASGFYHPNLVALSDYGCDEQLGPYLVLEYIPGIGLDDILESEKRLRPHVLIEVFSQICKGLSHVHSKGLIHRDLKPSNVMIVRDEHGDLLVKIVDFGIAKEQSRAQSITHTGEVLGSPLYMSPEQAKAEKVDTRSDIYSVGCMLYEAATGQPPFNGENALQTLAMRLNQEPPSFAEVAPFACLSEELERVVRRALQRDPGERYQTMAALGADLRELIKVHPAPTEMSQSLKALRVTAPIVEVTTPKEPVRWKEIAVQAALVALGLAVLMVFAWFVMQDGKKVASRVPPVVVSPSIPAPAAIPTGNSGSNSSQQPAAQPAPADVAEPVVNDEGDSDAPVQEVLQQGTAYKDIPAPVKEQWEGIDKLIKLRQHDQASQRCEKLISDLNAQGYQLNAFTAEIHCAAGVESAELKDFPTAQAHLNTAVQIFAAHKMVQRQGRTLIGLAQLEYMMKLYGQAYGSFAEAEKLLRPVSPGYADQALAAMKLIEPLLPKRQ